MDADVNAEFFINQSKKLQDDLQDLGFKIKYYEENVNYLRAQKNKLEESILDMQVALSKHHTTSLSKVANKDTTSMENGEVKDDIVAFEISEMKNKLKADISGQPWAGDILGRVATLGKVDDGNLSRLLSEHLGPETMSAIVCKTYKSLEALEACKKEGLDNKILDISAIPSSTETPVDDSRCVICLDKLRPYSGQLVSDDDPQRRLDLVKPKSLNGEIPYGFLGFAVNMIDIDVADLHYASSSGHNLRETLFYNLFSNLQVYRSRVDMLKAIPFITNGAISLDGGAMKNSSTFYLGHPRRDISVQFSKDHKRGSNISSSYYETENKLKEIKWTKNQLVEDMQRVQSLLDNTKSLFEVKKREFVQFIAGTSPSLATSVIT